MIKLGINTGKDLKMKEKAWLIKNFSGAGAFFYDLARGIDTRPVEPHWERKSIGKETTFPRDISDISEIIKHLTELSWEIEEWMNKEKIRAKTVTLKIKYYDFKSITRSTTLKDPVFKSKDIMDCIIPLLKKTDCGKIRIRLAGISMSNFAGEPREADKKGQLDLPF
jgi:DNA polymerase-4